MDFYEVPSSLLPNLAGIEVVFDSSSVPFCGKTKDLALTVTGVPSQVPLHLNQSAAV